VIFGHIKPVPHRNTRFPAQRAWGRAILYRFGERPRSGLLPSFAGFLIHCTAQVLPERQGDNIAQHLETSCLPIVATECFQNRGNHGFACFCATRADARPIRMVRHTLDHRSGGECKHSCTCNCDGQRGCCLVPLFDPNLR
jgi:hypothetical protein